MDFNDCPLMFAGMPMYSETRVHLFLSFFFLYFTAVHPCTVTGFHIAKLTELVPWLAENGMGHPTCLFPCDWTISYQVTIIPCS